MKLVLATGIFPPDIGGPATYVATLAEELSTLGHDVTVVTYGQTLPPRGAYRLRHVSKSGGPLFRWRRYAEELRRAAEGADVVEAFSSVSVGIPLVLSRLRGPKLVLRLGGDFPWERATDRGYNGSLRAWFTSSRPTAQLLAPVLRRFDHLIFSTQYQHELYARAYRGLPSSSVIENALPGGTPVPHALHRPPRLLSFGRFVRFKNLPALARAMVQLPDCHLTFVGEGPDEGHIRSVCAAHPPLTERIRFLPPAHGAEKTAIFAEHDLLVVPSLTDISPNSALEARSAGLPVLLTRETGLSERLTKGMMLADLQAPDQIASAVRSALSRYDVLAAEAATPPVARTWSEVAADHIALFSRLR